MEELWPFLKPFLQTFGICLIIIAGVYALLFWYERREEEVQEESPQSWYARVATLANRIERGQATTEEEQEYYELITSFWGRMWFRDYDSKNYKEISERARSAAEKFF